MNLFVQLLLAFLDRSEESSKGLTADFLFKVKSISAIDFLSDSIGFFFLRVSSNASLSDKPSRARFRKESTCSFEIKKFLSCSIKIPSKSSVGILVRHLPQIYLGLLRGTYIFSPQLQNARPANSQPPNSALKVRRSPPAST